MNTSPERRIFVAVMVALLGVTLLAGPVAAQEHVHSKWTGLGFDVPDGWLWTTHGAPDNGGHDHDEGGHDHDDDAHDDDAHADSIPHHLLVNYPGGLDGESPADSSQILLEMGALPESFLCDANPSDLEGYLESVVGYFALAYPELQVGSVDGYASALPDGTPVGAADMSFPGIEATWIAWPSETGVAFWAFAGSVEPVAHDHDAWRIAEGLHADLDGHGMAELLAAWELSGPCPASLPDTATAGAGGPGEAGFGGVGWLFLVSVVGLATVLRLQHRLDVRPSPAP